MNLAWMSIFKKITEAGLDAVNSIPKKRAVVLTNYIALILSLCCFLILIIIPQNHNWAALLELTVGAFLFSVPILLNRNSMTNASRLYLCWLPPILLIWYTTLWMKDAVAVPVSAYDGLRFYLLAFGCIPYLLMDRQNIPVFIAGIIPGLVCTVFCDFFLDMAGVGYDLKGIPDNGYSLTPLRSFVSYLIISGSGISLNVIIAKGDALNQKLLSELAEKNILIQRQAADEVLQLNEQLTLNLQHLGEREFILNQSQQIAKIGSWEYRIEDDFLFWTDEMYEIFGLDKSFNIRTGNLSEALGAEGAERLTNATLDLLRTGEAFDITIRTKTPIGYNKWFRVYAYPIVEQKNAVGVIGICHDITFFKEAEEKLRASQMKFSKVFENYPDFIMVVRETDLLVVDVNQRITNILGFDKDEVMGQSARKMDLFLSEEERQNFISSYTASGYTEHECLWRRKDGRLIEVKITGIRLDIDGQYYRMSVVQDVTEKKHAEKEKEYARYLLNERIKELTTLYRTSQVLHDEYRPFHEVMWNIISILPAGLQFPEIAVARISLADQEFESVGFARAVHKQSAQFQIQPGLTGTVEVAYIENRDFPEGPFSPEEHNLLEMVADLLGEFLARRHEQESLLKAQANLNATINNTGVLIWSVDRQFRLLTFNIPFYKYIQNYYGIEVEVGRRIFDSVDVGDVKTKWTENYTRALAGEIVILEDTRHGIDFQYSLSPIIEDNLVSGVSIFADNVTERKTKDLELAEANKKIGELKLMALRSVMSPHFIFNVLNSIQYFISRNDRLNAINYLTTFSKLIRSILTQSVNNKIKLADEIDMLKNYVKLEMMRFENKFNFILNVDPNVDIEAIELPSLLIQPYVENAILHGLYNKRGSGTLKIDIYEENDTVIFLIEDDGIGREAAMKLRQQNSPAHKSMGIKLTEERLRLINQKHNVAFEIEDLKVDQNPVGTRVRIDVIC